MIKEGVFIGHLQAFVQTASLGNVTRAADTLFLSQPALTARLNRLEQELGCALLQRDRQGARLTEAGRAFLPFAERVLEAVTEGEQRIREICLGLRGRLVIATSATVGANVLPPIVHDFCRLYPEVELAIHAASSDDVLAAVLGGIADLGIGRAIHHPDVDSRALYDEEFVLVAAPHHPRGAESAIDSHSLASELLILHQSSSSLAFTKELQRRVGGLTRGVIEVDNPEVLTKLACEGVGLAIMSRTAVADDIERELLRELRLVDMALPRRRIAALRRKDAPEYAPISEFLAILDAGVASLRKPAERLRRARTATRGAA